MERLPSPRLGRAAFIAGAFTNLVMTLTSLAAIASGGTLQSDWTLRAVYAAAGLTVSMMCVIVGLYLRVLAPEAYERAEPMDPSRFKSRAVKIMGLSAAAFLLGLGFLALIATVYLVATAPGL